MSIDLESKEDYETCSGCGKQFKMIVGDVCYHCTYDNPLFWCYKHEHFSHNRKPCQICITEKKSIERKGMPIGL